MQIPLTPFQWQSWDCFTLVNWIRAKHNLPTIDAAWVYRLHPTVDSFHKNALLSIVPSLGLRRQGISHLNILMIESFDGEYTLGTAIALDNLMHVALMGQTHAHMIPLDRLHPAAITAWIPTKNSTMEEASRGRTDGDC